MKIFVAGPGSRLTEVPPRCAPVARLCPPDCSKAPYLLVTKVRSVSEADVIDLPPVIRRRRNAA